MNNEYNNILNGSVHGVYAHLPSKKKKKTNKKNQKKKKKSDNYRKKKNKVAAEVRVTSSFQTALAVKNTCLGLVDCFQEGAKTCEHNTENICENISHVEVGRHCNASVS